MYLITFKKGLNSEISKIEFEQPMTFLKANEMLLEAVNRYKQTGQSIKVSYKIVEINTGESIFNSKISIDRDIPSLYQLIKENSNTPKMVVDYVVKVENRVVIEEEDIVSFNINNHVEEKARLEQLKAEKNEILQQLKKDEKERQQRDLEYQKKMKEIQDEKKALEKALLLKEKEEAMKESQRIEALRLLEEKKANAIQLMEEKRNLDKKKKEEHEKRLKEVEEEARKAEIELASIKTELEKNELERKRELQELEEKKLEADRKVSVLKAEGDKNEVKHQRELIDYKEIEEGPPISNSNNQTTMVMPKLTLKERLQELDFEEVKALSIQLAKSTFKGSIKASKTAYTMVINYYKKRANEKQEKLKALNKKVEIEEKLTLEKIKFMEELKKDRLKQEKEYKKEVRLKEREALKQAKIEERYRAAKSQKLNRKPVYRSGAFKFTLGLVVFVTAALGVTHYFNLGDTFPILMELENYMDSFFSKTSATIQKG